MAAEFDLAAAARKEAGYVLKEDGLPSDVVRWVSTGATLLDYCISNQEGGGIPVGKMTEISGLEGSGKTLFMMQLARTAQKEGALIIYVDSENAVNSDFANRIGLETPHQNLVYLGPTTIKSLEDGFEYMFKLFHMIDEAEKKNGLKYPYILFIWDSIAASPPREDLNAENASATSNVGLAPRVLAKNFRTIVEQTGRRNVALVFTNQLRSVIGAGPFQEKWNETGGKAKDYYYSVRVRLTPVGKIKIGEEVVGIKTQAVVRKTRFGPPHRKCDFNIYFGYGVDDTESIIDLLEKEGVVKTKSGGQKGKLFTYGDVEGMNRVDFKKKVLNDQTFRTKIMNEVSKVMTKEMANPFENEESVEASKEE